MYFIDLRITRSLFRIILGSTLFDEIQFYMVIYESTVRLFNAHVSDKEWPPLKQNKLFVSTYFSKHWKVGRQNLYKHKSIINVRTLHQKQILATHSCGI